MIGSILRAELWYWGDALGALVSRCLPCWMYTNKRLCGIYIHFSVAAWRWGDFYSGREVLGLPSRWSVYLWHIVNWPEERRRREEEAAKEVERDG